MMHEVRSQSFNHLIKYIMTKRVPPHYHTTMSGKVIECYHTSKKMLLSTEFWVALTISYPLEHMLWEQTFLRHVLTFFGASH